MRPPLGIRSVSVLGHAIILTAVLVSAFWGGNISSVAADGEMVPTRPSSSLSAIATPLPVPPSRLAAPTTTIISTPLIPPTRSAVPTATPNRPVVTPAPTMTPVPTVTPPVTTVALGAWVSPSPWDGGTALDAFTAAVGTQPAVANWYQNWVETCCNSFDVYKMDVVASRGIMPLVSWSPCENNVTFGGAPCSDAAIAGTDTGGAGIADTYLRQFARDAHAWNKPFYLRLAWEMNGTWYPWSPGNNGNTAASYVAMWRHVHDIFAQEGATNVRWVWCPNSFSYMWQPVPYADLYPGDAYVDWVGLDGYNWGPGQPWGSVWHSFLQEFAAPYDTLTAMTNKPIMVVETSSTQNGGDKAAWIQQAFLVDIPAHFPRLRAVIWFNQDKESDWRVDSSAASLVAYRAVAALPQYKGRLP